MRGELVLQESHWREAALRSQLVHGVARFASIGLARFADHARV
jgi:hypothetical protein